MSDYEELLGFINGTKPFAYLFKFEDEQFFISLLEELQINYEEFIQKQFYYNKKKELHVSKSDFGYVWISTTGLVAKGKPTSNRAVNAFRIQHTVISLLIEKAIEIIEDESVYDIDSYNNGYLCELSPAIYHNLVFYAELFYKAYLSLAGHIPPRTHRLIELYDKTKEVTAKNGHKNTLMQVYILDQLSILIEHIKDIPNPFMEHNIKYDDNKTDDSVILFRLLSLYQISDLLDNSIDFITQYFYEGEATIYLKPNLYQDLLARADSDEKKQRIREMYPHLM